MSKDSTLNSIVNIVMLLDDKYFFCTYVALRSMKINKKTHSHYNIFILADNVSSEKQMKLQFLNDKNFIIKIIDVKEYSKKYKSIAKVFHISNTALVKFDIMNILYKLDKVLYLDGDVLVNKDLSELFNIDISDFYLGAVREMRAESRKYFELTNTKYYFNSGVLLLNLKKLREDDISTKLIQTKLNQPKNWRCMDQDVFNNVINNNFKQLPLVYNNFVSIFLAERLNIKKINSFYKTNFLSYRQLCKKSTIIHFASNLKPWIYDLGYLSKMYQKYSKTYTKLQRYTNENRFLEKIFSIKNSYDRKHKVITILGVKINVKRRDNMLKKILQNVFSVKRKEHHKIITILGIKIKLFQPKTDDVYYCPICNQYGQFLPFGVIPRPAAKCPHCGSLERHRFLYFIYKKYFLNTNKQIKLLHTAPEKCIYDLIKKNPKIDYTPIDLFPEGYKFCQCLKEDVTNLSFKDNTFDFVISNQVMEHILDENKFLSELLRVLKPGGYLLLNFPVFMDLEKTFQDDSITSPEDREKYYGQSDHVRKYGRDIFDKLKKKYNAKVIFVKDFRNNRKIEKYKLYRTVMSDHCIVIQK